MSLGIILKKGNLQWGKNWPHPLAVVLNRVGETQARLNQLSAYLRKDHRSRVRRSVKASFSGLVNRTLVLIEFWLEMWTQHKWVLSKENLLKIASLTDLWAQNSPGGLACKSQGRLKSRTSHTQRLQSRGNASAAGTQLPLIFWSKKTVFYF